MLFLDNVADIWLEIFWLKKLTLLIFIFSWKNIEEFLIFFQ